VTLNPNADYTTREGAEQLANHIRGYWRAKGRMVRVYVYRSMTSQGERFDVRSDLTGAET
jgi:hypothetical protein